MRTLFLLSMMIGIALNSPCTDVTPTKSDDCLSIQSPDSICCMRSITVGNEPQVDTCEDRNITYSGKNEFEEQFFQGIRTKNLLNCNIKVELCGPISASKAKKCIQAKIPNGVCCFDKTQEVCFSYPYHFSSENIVCKIKEEEEAELIKLQKLEKKLKEKKKEFYWPWEKTKQ